MKKIKKYLKQKIDSMSIIKKLNTLYVLVIVLPIAFLSVLILKYEHTLLSRYHADLITSDMVRIQAIMEEITSQVNAMSEDISQNTGIIQALNTTSYMPNRWEDILSRIKIIKSFIDNYEVIQDIAIYTDNPTIHQMHRFFRADKKTRSQPWYKEVKESDTPIWMYARNLVGTTSEYSDSLCLVKKIIIPESNYIGIVIIRLNNQYLAKRIYNSDYIAMMSVDYSPVIVSTDSRWEKLDIPIKNEHEGRYRKDKTYYSKASVVPLGETKTLLHICLLSENAYSRIRNVTLTCFFALLIAMLIPAILVFYARLYEIRLKETEFINHQQAMEFEMLASQINPHFLYNTLESIRMKAITNNDKEVANGIKLLGKSMRYVLENTGKDCTSLENELEHVRTYINIQELRFGARFKFDFNVDDNVDTRSITVLPLIVQPLVENSLLHGLKEIDKDGHVTIEVKENNNYLYIAVTDNGKGMTKEQIEDILSNSNDNALDRTNSYGLNNIDQRLKLYYGQECGLNIESEPDVKTSVIMMIPIRMQ